MSVYKLSDLFMVGVDILNTSTDATNGTILAQVGDVVSEQSFSDNAELWQTPGIASRPRSPTAGKTAAQAIAIRHSDRDVIIATRDVDSQNIYGNIKEGETCLYAPGTDGTSQAKVLLKGSGKINLMTTEGNVEGGETVFFQVSPSGFAMVGPWGKMTFDDNGFHVVTNGGARLDMGGVAGLPAPFDAMNSYATLQASNVGIAGQVVTTGPAGAQDPLVLWTPLAGYFTALNTAIALALTNSGAPAGAAAGLALGSTMSGLLTGLGMTAPASTCGSLA